ncbi:hypothetical protein CYY_006071 [Polysphondylium violaceum]|uniref:Mannosylglycerate hydrolase MGH1-like glycoside hydrolase domain-containing protein n=1 Tax=Polysphondylium violaceum TaxID=133409 RepID=A0A8J4PSB1_9MYCE|nr:hypothetical protein CYY_006071 [Polysphondylium violaceum]
MIPEKQRLQDSLERKADWKNWGTYVGDREWSTVKEDYSPNSSNTWDYFPHDHARSRAYRWSEDSIGGFCNRFQNICLGNAFWNGKDPIIKERLFGLPGTVGNHGEDVKEHYFYLDNTPTHSYSKMLYKYPMNEYPYSKLEQESRARDRYQAEYEIEDTGIFDNDEYFDCYIEYAKADQDDILCKITAINRSKDKEAPIYILPHLWYRNTWSWGYSDRKPVIKNKNTNQLETEEVHIGKRYYSVYDPENPRTTYLFTDNETNNQRLFNVPNKSPYVKDGINNAVVYQEKGCTNNEMGSKVAAKCFKLVKPGESYTVKIRFSNYQQPENPFIDFDSIFETRIQEADQFYESSVHTSSMSVDTKRIQRQSLAGLLWTKQYYHFGVNMWKNGDPNFPRPEKVERNSHWDHFYANDVISMPDKFEFPFLASWDLAFQMMPMMLIDVEWTKRQLILITREWYTHSSGQFPAYEWDFGDVNPPVHAWACLMVYQHIEKTTGEKDLEFLEQVFHKCLLNFNWWVNRKDVNGNNIFESTGFLGLDNIGVFDRSSKLPEGKKLQQADGTSWMAFYSANMLKISLILAKERKAYESIATKFLEHFINIAKSITSKSGLWNQEEGFFFDSIFSPKDSSSQIKIFSFVGLIPLFACEILDSETLVALPKFKERLDWFVKYRPNLVKNIAPFTILGENGNRLLSIVDKEKLQRLLGKMLDENWFLSENGIRSLSKTHQENPFILESCDSARVDYNPGESTSGMFGGNSNWRGPVWLAVNYLMIQSLRTYYQYYGDSFQLEYPTGSGHLFSLNLIADDLSKRIVGIFSENEKGVRKFTANKPIYQKEHWKNNLLFHEYFHGDNGLGLGASHQTGWTALVAKLINELNE